MGRKSGGPKSPPVDWEQIRLEYITNSAMTLTGLARKHDLNVSAISAHSKKEEWRSQKREFLEKTRKKALESLAEKEVDRRKRIFGLADNLLSKIEDLSSDDEITVQNLEKICKMLKDIKDIQGVKSEIDVEEQRFRIAKLKKDSADLEREPTVRVVIDPDLSGLGE